MQSLLEILQKSEDFLSRAGLETAKIDAEWILSHALGIKRLQLFLQFERPLDEEELQRIRPLLKRRSQREPLQYILGTTAFHGIELRTDARALVPRPETEELVELVLGRLQEQGSAGKRLIDLGTGTGAIALALAAARPEVELWATDVSEEALSLARENADRLGMQERIRFVRANWWDGLEGGTFDVVVSNPPYLTEQEWAEAQPEVRQFEPRQALVAAANGTSDLRVVLEGASKRLNPGGSILLETGLDQHEALRELANASGFSQTISYRDLTGRERFFEARL